jgi:hypothetical protein
MSAVCILRAEEWVGGGREKFECAIAFIFFIISDEAESREWLSITTEEELKADVG